MQEIFVFGSNLAGRHGKGAALFARQNHGAVYGKGVGLQGNSYAIPTKDAKIKTLPLEVIKKYVDEFITFADKHKELKFILTPIGCGLAGYEHKQIAPMFFECIGFSNVVLPKEFLDILNANQS